jgi:hypothetical protein
MATRINKEGVVLEETDLGLQESGCPKEEGCLACLVIAQPPRHPRMRTIAIIRMDSYSNRIPAEFETR